jgi:tetratricopeptide (TPR) repeat protein
MKRKVLLFIILFLLTVFPLFSQELMDPWKSLMNDDWESAKKIWLSDQDNYLSNIGLALLNILEDNPKSAWNFWEKSIKQNASSSLHNVIGLLGEYYWDDIGKTPYFSELLKSYPKRAEFLDFLYFKSLKSKNDIDGLLEFKKKKGLVDQWIIIGPFDNVGNSGFYKEYPPEKEIDLNKSYLGKGGMEIKWFTPKFTSRTGYISLYNLLYPNKWSVGYALTYFYLPVDQKVIFNIGSAESIALWVNDIPIIKEDAERSAFFGQKILRMELSAGWHKLLIKVANTDGDFGFFLSITDSQLNPIDGIRFSKEPQKYVKRIFKFEERDIELALAEDITYMPCYYLFAGYLLMEKGLYSKSEEILNMGLKILPNSSIIKYFLGRLYLNMGKEEKGKELILEASRKIPSLTQAFSYLAYYSYSKNRYEEAINYLKSALNENPSAFQAREILSRIFLKRGWLKEADDEIRFFEKEYPESLIKDYLRGWWFESRKQYEKAIEKYNDVIKRDFEYWEGIFSLYYLAKDLARWNIVEKILDELEKKYIDDPWIYQERADILVAKGEEEKALELLNIIPTISPYYPHSYLSMAEIFNIKGDKESAINYYEKTLELEPGYQKVREYLSYLREETITPPDINDFLKIPIKKEYLDYPAVIILDEKKRIVHKDGSCTNIYHTIIKVQNDKGRERYGEITIDYDSSFESVRIIRARTIKPNGEELEAVSIKDFAIAEDYPLYTDQRQIVISMPGVESGAILECFYIVEEFTRSIFGKEFQDLYYFQWQDPVIISRYQLRVPRGIEFKYETYNIDIKPVINEDKDFIVYTWEYKDVPPLIQEPYMPYYPYIAPQLWITTYKDWETLADWFASISYPQIRSDKAIEDKVKELTSDKRTREDKIKAIYYYVISQIRYVGLEYGIRGILPHQAPEIFKVKYGDCKDKAVLLVTMLRLAGIESYYTLVNTRFSTPLRKELPGFQFDHAICSVPIKGGFLFLDGTAEDTPMGEVPVMDQGADVMILKDDGSYIFTKIPMSKAQDNGVYYKVKLSIDEKGKLFGEVKSETKGHYSVYYRWKYKSASSLEKEEAISQGINVSCPGSILKSWSMENLDNLDLPVRINFTFENDKYIKRDGVVYFNPIIFTTITSAVEVGKPERRYPIHYYYPYEIIEDIEILIPSSWKIKNLPSEITLNYPWVTYERKVSINGNNIKIKKTFRLERIEISLEEYKDYKEAIEKIIKLEQEMIMAER